MTTIHRLHDPIAVVGWSCRLPGAPSIPALWSLLLEGRCAVGTVPEDRFSHEQFLHPRKQERGRAYTFAAGAIGDILAFDPAVFRMSPREAEQVDPQQRLLLQLTWEALEDAGITPTSIAGTDVGVFVGGSLTDYAHAFYGDPAVGDPHFATGNALASLANRISYSFNLHGPSMTVDTACSSSLVALHQAMEALRSGRIDTAIVGGVNLIGSAMSFITFSQASMLSPTGLCQAFDAAADGFVRAEGGAVIVLRKGALAHKARNPVHGVILASDVNSDGRTNGLSLPSSEAQEALINRVYGRAGIAPSRVAFVEAHGTGTAVGDPVEAGAIGRGLGRERDTPLLIGSIKTNIGHLEPASGLAGLLKALLALNHGVLPPSLHFRKGNPNIDFEGLNLSVCDRSVLLPDVPDQCAGVNSFGFGGTNAHVVVGPGEPWPESSTGSRPGFFAISAQTRPALVDLARAYAARIAPLSDDETATVAAAAAYRREPLSQRLVVSSAARDDVVEALAAFEAGQDHPKLTVGNATGADLPTAFVFTGNGGQKVGMGRAAYQASAAFRERFDQIDRHFAPLAGWSLKDAVFDDALGERLHLTSVVQPLIFAIQSAAAYALRETGLTPTVVLGHSVGEVAAAESAGILDLKTAVKIIHFRSRHQELAAGAGGMAAVSATPEEAAALCAEVDGLEIAAYNSPRSATLAGPTAAMEAGRRLARKRGIAFLDLRLAYPFHTSGMAPIQGPLVHDLAGIAPMDAATPFVSTVTGLCVPGHSLGADYWWRNVREPVRFCEAVREAAKLGGRCFVEIGPASLLLKHIGDSLKDEGGDVTAMSALGSGADSGADPIAQTVARALVAGAKVKTAAVFGQDPGGGVPLPHYPWQQKPYRFTHTTEAQGVMEADRHRYAGARLNANVLEWTGHVDIERTPELAGHGVGSQVLFPGTGFLELGFSVASQWLGTGEVALSNFEILRPLDLTGGETHEVLTRIGAASGTLEILSRPRLSTAAWTTHCRAKVRRARPLEDRLAAPEPGPVTAVIDHDALYAIADACGLRYGPDFALNQGVAVHPGEVMTATLSPAADGPRRFVVDPMRLDACLHPVITLFPRFGAAERGVAYVPVRVDEAVVHAAGVAPERVVVEMHSVGERSMLCTLHVMGAGDCPVVTLRGARCQAVPVRRLEGFEQATFIAALEPADGGLTGKTGLGVGADAILAAAEPFAATGEDTAAAAFDAFALSAAYEIAAALATRKFLSPAALADSGRIPDSMRPWIEALLHALADAGYAEDRSNGAFRLGKAPPPSARQVATLAAEHPDRAGEVLLAAELASLGRRILAEHALPESPLLTPAAIALMRTGETAGAEADALLFEVLQRALPRDRTLRVLQVGQGLIGPRLATHAPVTVTLHDGDAPPTPGAYDMVVVRDLVARPSESLTAALAPGGVLVGLAASPSLFQDLVRGLDPAWFDGGVAGFPTSPLRPVDAWASHLGHARPVTAGGRRLTLYGVSRPADDAATAANDPISTIHVVEGSSGADPVAELADRVLRIKTLAAETGSGPLWLGFSDALGADPVSAGAYAFTRVLANEFPALDIRRVDVAADVAGLGADGGLNGLNAASPETEIRLTAAGPQVVRADSIKRRLNRTLGAGAAATRLQRVFASGARLQWLPAKRPAPGPGEVEIAVAAVGVNFRDLMWSLGLLPDDILEGGFAGATLGLECAGTVARLGAGVTGLNVGDPVVALAGGAYASHVNVTLGQVARLPAGLSLDDAAALPVAFLTAWYSLITQARLDKGEWVLIHGGAGGVGLAAIQVAKLRGAKIIATAGSAAKRALLRALGVDHVLDSRTTGFVDRLRTVMPQGVDVVLNSLSGEAMELSLSCLAPFGRFVELGKRDFVSDTQVGLRAFRNNISYFAVDVDQLVMRGDLGRKLFAEIVAAVGKKRLKPLLHTAFDGASVSDAFALMQHSTHVGKILVRPSAPATVRAARAEFVVDPEGSHLITGAFGGFGLETAKWLAAQGARHLVMVGRSGPASPEAQAVVEALRARGVTVMAEACDIADRASVKTLLARAAAELPPITGVMHAAMVLDDAIIDNLDEARLLPVLRPKVAGAEHLDALTRDLPLGYFVLFSSVTTLVGNPGQGAYVAANAYMEGLARRRRKEGLPALAVGWGPIGDVGVVARNAKLQAGLQKLTGARPLMARDGLQLMAQALAEAADDPALAVVTIAPNDGSFGGDRLPILKSPTYAALVRPRGAGAGAEASPNTLDVAALLKSIDEDAAARQIGDLIADRLARVLRTDLEDIARNRPLAELGLDSLMALELGMSLEEGFGVHIALSGSAGAMTVNGLARDVIAQARGGGSGGSTPEADPADDGVEATKASAGERRRAL